MKKIFLQRQFHLSLSAGAVFGVGPIAVDGHTGLFFYPR